MPAGVPMDLMTTALKETQHARHRSCPLSGDPADKWLPTTISPMQHVCKTARLELRPMQVQRATSMEMNFHDKKKSVPGRVICPMLTLTALRGAVT